MGITAVDRGKYLQALPGGECGRGMYDASHTTQTDGYDWVTGLSGVAPRVLAMDWDWQYTISGRNNLRAKFRDKGATGALVTLAWHKCYPAVGEPCTYGTDVINRTLTEQEWADILNPSSQLYADWLSMVSELADELQALQDDNIVVLLRPYHEPNILTFWWGNGAATPEQYKALYVQFYTYMTVTRGLQNLIWVQAFSYHPNYLDDMVPYYPGDAYVDVLGVDLYSQGSPYADAWDKLNVVSATKPKIISECNISPTAAELAARDWRVFVNYGRTDTETNMTEQEIIDAFNVEPQLESPGLYAILTPRLTTSGEVLLAPVSPVAGDITCAMGYWPAGATPTTAEVIAGTGATSFASVDVLSFGHAAAAIAGDTLHVALRDSAGTVVRATGDGD